MEKLKWWPICKAKRIGIKAKGKAKTRARGKAQVELGVKIKEEYVVFLVTAIMYSGSARSGRSSIKL